jgi:pyruvate dehydrogenase E2 component (dihydrolipoamide acetyltransferase)
MAISVVMPALEMAQENGKLLAWRKKEGESVSKGEPLLEIETDKAVVEVEAPGDGILAGVTAEVGAVVPVGETIAWLVAPGENPPAKLATAAPGARATSTGAQASAARPAAAKTASVPASVQISPKARRLAKELGVDYTRIRGTGPDGTITADDVQASAATKETSAQAPAASAATAAAGTHEPLSQLARLMAERTTQSWTSVPHFFLAQTVDAGPLQTMQKRLSADSARGAAPTITDILIGVLARVLEKHPKMNASWTGDGIRLNPEINISVAMAVKDGVVGAVIPGANKQAIAALSALRRELTERARAGRLRPTDITGGTFTLSNLGMYKVHAFSAIIAQPQCAILAVGAIADAVVPVDGNPGIRPMMTMTLSSDHRVVDGARAAEFLDDLVNAIREPEKWL